MNQYQISSVNERSVLRTFLSDLLKQNPDALENGLLEIIFVGINSDFVLEEETEFLNDPQFKHVFKPVVFSDSPNFDEEYASLLDGLNDNHINVVNFNCRIFSKRDFPG